MLKLIPGIALMATLAGCAAPEPKEPPLEGIVVISSGPCLGLCPVFTMQVDAEDRYRLDSGVNTIKEGRSTGGLPAGSYRRALDLLDKYLFHALRNYTAESPRNCPERISGTPTLTIERKTNAAQQTVTYDVGCLGFAEKEILDQLVAGLYRTFRINDLVAVGEPPKAGDQQGL